MHRRLKRAKLIQPSHHIGRVQFFVSFWSQPQIIKPDWMVACLKTYKDADEAQKSTRIKNNKSDKKNDSDKWSMRPSYGGSFTNLSIFFRGKDAGS